MTEQVKKRGRPKGSKSKKDPVYLLKQNNKIYIVPTETINELKSEDVLRLWMVAIVEQRRQLLEDAVFGDQYFDDELKIVDGLEASMRKFQEMYPWIKQQIKIYGVDNRIGRS